MPITAPPGSGVQRSGDARGDCLIVFQTLVWHTSKTRGATRLDGARGKTQVWRLHVRIWGRWDWKKYLWQAWDFSASPQWFGARGFVYPLSLRPWSKPLPNSSIEQWRMVVIVAGYTLSVASQFDNIFSFVNKRFNEVCWHSVHIILQYTRSPYSLLYNVSL